MEKIDDSLTLFECLGRGGMAEVYRGILTRIGGFEKPVAVKKILPQMFADPLMRSMFLAEARLAAKFSHPNIAQVFDAKEKDGTLFIVMEYVEGRTLRDLMDTAVGHNKPVPLEVACNLIEQITEGLSYAHHFRDPITHEESRVIHRDITPRNLMVTENGGLKILDFGIAKSIPIGQDATLTNNPLGTPAYMSPEAIRGEKLDERVDLFSLGVVFFELLTGISLFKGNTAEETRDNIQKKTIPDVRKLRSDTPPDLAKIIKRLIERNARKRTPSAAALLHELKEIAVALPHPSDIKAWYRNTVADAAIERTLTDENEVNLPMREPIWRPSPFFKGHTKLIRVLIGSLAIAALLIWGGSKIFPIAKIPKIFWDNGGQLVDLSFKPRPYETVWERRSLSAPACMELCTYIGTFAYSWMLEKQATDMDKAPNAKKASVYFADFLSKLKSNDPIIKGIWRHCDWMRFCESAKNLTLGLVDAASKIKLSSEETYHSLMDKLLKVNSEFWSPIHIADYLKPDKFHSEQWTAWTMSFDASEHFAVSTIFGIDFVRTSVDVFPQSDSDCQALGDLYYVRRSGVIDPTRHWGLQDTRLWILPKGSGQQVRGSKGQNIIVELPEGISDLIFTKGMCLYSRIDGKLQVARHWVPRLSAQALYQGANRGQVPQGQVDQSAQSDPLHGVWKAINVTCPDGRLTKYGSERDREYVNERVVLARKFSGSTGAVIIVYFGKTKGDFCQVLIPTKNIYRTGVVEVTNQLGTVKQFGKGIDGNCSKITTNLDSVDRLNYKLIGSSLTLDFPNGAFCSSGVMRGNYTRVAQAPDSDIPPKNNPEPAQTKGISNVGVDSDSSASTHDVHRTVK